MSHNWKGALPAGVKVNGSLATDPGFIVSPGGGCGGAIFILNAGTKEKLELKGLEYLNLNTVPRRWDNGSLKWESVKADTNISYKYHFSCALGSLGRDSLRSELKKALGADAGYFGVFSDDPDGTKVMILPDRNVVLVGYWDN